MVELDKKYPEIQRFQRVPGIGVVGGHVFSAFIQTPHRFATKQRLWKYCKFGISERSSAGKSLAYKRLDRSGLGALKDLSYQCWQTSQQVVVSNGGVLVLRSFTAPYGQSNPCTTQHPAKSPHSALDHLEKRM